MKRRTPTELPSKYFLYEESVQSPKLHVGLLRKWYKNIKGRHPHTLREDFCGTFAISHEFVKADSKNRAWAIDLDAEPLMYGMRERLLKSPLDLQERIELLRQDVREPTRPLVDLAIACNFSFQVFYDESTLRSYFDAVRRSLNSDGVFILEVAGGPGFIEKTKDKRTVRAGRLSWKYIWDQQYFDPISHRCKYAIHFEMKNKKSMKNAFTYDWRLWTIPELRFQLKEAGFKDTCVFWEVAENEYVRSKSGENDYAWIAHVVGIKSGNAS